MQTTLIFGASRGVGLALARLLRAEGAPVVAMLRAGSDSAELEAIGVRIVRGDAMSRSDIDHAFAGIAGDCDVVSTLGGTTPDGRRVDDEGNIAVIDAAVAHGVRRFVFVTSIGCGDMAPYRSERAITAFGAAVDAKTRAEDHLRRVLQSATIVRPGGLKSEPATGRGILTRDAQMHGFIHREDVAQLVARVLADVSTAGETFACVDIDMAKSVNPIEPFDLRPLHS